MGCPGWWVALTPSDTPFRYGRERQNFAQASLPRPRHFSRFLWVHWTLNKNPTHPYFGETTERRDGWLFWSCLSDESKTSEYGDIIIHGMDGSPAD